MDLRYSNPLDSLLGAETVRQFLLFILDGKNINSAPFKVRAVGG